MNTKYFVDLFLKRIEETENDLVLKDEKGNFLFPRRGVFTKFFVKPEILVGYFNWRENGNGYKLFMEYYNEGWSEEATPIVEAAKRIFEQDGLKLFCYDVRGMGPHGRMKHFFGVVRAEDKELARKLILETHCQLVAVKRLTTRELFSDNKDENIAWIAEDEDECRK